MQSPPQPPFEGCDPREYAFRMLNEAWEHNLLDQRLNQFARQYTDAVKVRYFCRVELVKRRIFAQWLTHARDPYWSPTQAWSFVVDTLPQLEPTLKAWGSYYALPRPQSPSCWDDESLFPGELAAWREEVDYTLAVFRPPAPVFGFNEFFEWIDLNDKAWREKIHLRHIASLREAWSLATWMTPTPPRRGK